MKLLTITKAAAKALGKMPRKDSETLARKLESYARGEPQDVIKLQGSGMYRLRRGDWRALLVVTKTEITVAAIVDRREAYR